MSELELNVENYEADLIAYIREIAASDEAIAALNDEEISYLLSLWDEYLDTLDLDEEQEDFEVDSDALYAYVREVMNEDDRSIDISLDTLVELIELEEDFVDFLFEEENDN